MAENWVVVLGTDWRTQYAGEPPWKQIGKFLKPLVESLPFSQVQIEWRHFLAATPAQYVSIPRFVATHGSWGSPTSSVVRLPYVSKYPDANEADRRAGIPVDGD